MLYRIAEHKRQIPSNGRVHHYWLVELGFHDIGSSVTRWHPIQRHTSQARAIAFLVANGIEEFYSVFYPSEPSQ